MRRACLVSIGLFVSGGITACADKSEESESAATTTTTTSEGGGGGAAGHGGSGGSGGSGGAACEGPCCEVPAKKAAIAFTAPESHEDGLVGISAEVVCPAESTSGECQDVPWYEPYPGSVAPDGEDTVVAIFGERPAGTKITYIAGLHASDVDPAFLWFSENTPNGVVNSGTHVACIGTMSVGSVQDGEFVGALAQADLADPNVVFTVPEAQ